MDNQIIHGDSLTILRQMDSDSIDAIITDPPYGIGYQSKRFGRISNDKLPFIWWLYDGYRVLKDGGCMLAGSGGGGKVLADEALANTAKAMETYAKWMEDNANGQRLC